MEGATEAELVAARSSGGPVDPRHAHPGTDIRAVLDGYVSVTPLDTSLTNEAHIEALSAKAEALAAALARPQP